MIPDSAEPPFSSTAGLSAAGLPPRLLWQVPVFFLGLLALAGVCIARPPWRPIDAHRAERELLAARHLLERSDVNREQWQIALERLEEHQERLPQRSAEFRFLIGSIQLRLAGTGPSSETIANARKAHLLLEEAQAQGVPDADQPALLYRRGKALALMQADPKQIIDLLTRSIERGADDPFEGHGLLAQAYLRLPAPDLSSALLANEKQLEQPTIDEKKLAPVRLQRGELLLRLNRPEDARRVLGRIGPQAPPALQAQARFLRARSLQEEQRWEEAAALWKESVDDARLPMREPGWTLYFLGVCYRQLEQLEEAARVWEQCARRVDGGDEAVAAALGLAELRLLDEAPDALAGFERAVQGVESPADWRNSLVDLEKARALFERGLAVYREAGDAERGMQLAKWYERLALPGAASFLRAQAADSGARVKQGEEARSLYRQAGEAYEQSAARTPQPDDQMERLWLSADRYRLGRDAARTAAVLQRVLPMVPEPRRRGEGWFALGEALRDLKDEAGARAAYRECINYPTPFAYRARYQLALLEIARNDPDEAVSVLQLNLKLLSTDPDREAEEKSLLALANVQFQRRQYRLALPLLEQVLRSYPESEGAVKARFQLAECHRLLAVQDAQDFRTQVLANPEARSHAEKEYYRRLEEAAQNYQQVAEVLAKREAKSLTAEEQLQLRQASFGAAEAWSNRGNYKKALARYEQLAILYAGRVEELHALSGIAQCHWRDGQAILAKGQVERLRKALQALPDSAFQGEPWSRAEWEKWLAEVSR